MKIKLLLLYIFLFCIAVFCSCNNSDEYILTLEQQYDNAVMDAKIAEVHEICKNLVVISSDNTALLWNNGMVLVLTFTRFPDSYPEGETIETWWGDSWVTAVPELQTAFDAIYPSVDDPLLRIEQLLGLPENSGNEWFVELWVDPDDLFRPCPDNEINDSACELSFPYNATAEHIEWFNNQYTEAFLQEQKYPWTQLGYTYDWDDLTGETGLSEFIIRKGASVVVERLERYEEYLSID